ncbi:unnamed protein product [Lactuca virosa]|uniref:Uncharacterized protein n=1 Tax=Lactuca virosa TaxID=75947 RepID=A0AAU9M9P6_9ASTR|nr:unnamed protein product [Lactuca virosa]
MISLFFFLTVPLHSLFSSGHQRTHASIISPSTRRTSQRSTADHRIPSSSHAPPPSQASVARTVKHHHPFFSLPPSLRSTSLRWRRRHRKPDERRPPHPQSHRFSSSRRGRKKQKEVQVGWNAKRGNTTYAQGLDSWWYIQVLHITRQSCGLLLV